MNDAAEMRDRMIKEFTENHMAKLFYFCLKKTGSSFEAEDLTQDIALNVIASLNRGTVPERFSAWIWQIACNRYSVWADNKHRRNESVTGSDISDYAIEDESKNILDEMIHGEQLSLLRRELAFIKSDYRDIVVAYYMENKSIRSIASALSLSVNAVQQRIHRARIILKEGMDMAREFGIRSYKPEEIAFVMNGRVGKHGQPWSIVTHMLYKNIFLEAYETPETAEELSLELGVVLPYMEDELEFLVREQLLCKTGNKYQTNFHIVSREERKVWFDENRTVQKPLTDKMCELIDTYMAEDGTKVNVDYVGFENAKWALLVRTFDCLQLGAEKIKNIESEYRNTYPSRPDDGSWTLTGYETINWQEPAFVGQHGSFTYDINEVKQDIEFGQFKFHLKDIGTKTPEYLTWAEAYTLWLVCSGRIEECETGYLDKLLAYGYLKKSNGEITPNIVILNRNAKKLYHKTLTEKLSALRNEIYDLFGQAPHIERGYVVEQALADGWLKYDKDTVNTVGAYIYL